MLYPVASRLIKLNLIVLPIIFVTMRLICSGSVDGERQLPMEGRKPKRGRGQGRGARYERSAAKRAVLLDGSLSEGYRLLV
ncbi:MAG TPA: hypothetical protein VM912_06920 [Terriglobales bacterium]|nr:hypothetical protein [Terriglobales bacterium]